MMCSLEDFPTVQTQCYPFAFLLLRIAIDFSFHSLCFSQTTQKIFNNKNADRPDVPNTIIIVADQPSSVKNKKLIQMAGKFKAAGGKVNLIISRFPSLLCHLIFRLFRLKILIQY